MAYNPELVRKILPGEIGTFAGVMDLTGQTLFDLVGSDKTPWMVHYARRRHVLTTEKEFFWPPVNPSPSDSTWIVPGT